MLFLFILLLLIFLFFAWFSLGKDIFQPSCLVGCSYLVSAVCALIMQSQWKYQYNISTFCVIFIGIIVIYLANLYNHLTRKKYLVSMHNSKNTIVLVSNNLLLCLIIVQVFAAVVYIREIIQIAGLSGDLSSIMTQFRMLTQFGDESVSFIASQLLNISFAICMISLYVFIHNILISGIQGNKRFLGPVILYSITSLMTGGRFNTIIVIIAGITLFWILYKRIKMRKFSAKIYICAVIFILLALFLFYAIRSFIGRTTTTSNESNFLHYICTYIGGPIPLFDMYLSNLGAWEPSRGTASFGNLLNTLNELGLTHISFQEGIFDFGYWNGYNLGNIYTGFAFNIQDFGIIGMCFMQFIFAFVMSRLYIRGKCCDSAFRVLIYAWFAHSLFLHCCSDIFYGNLITFGVCTKFIYLLFFYMVVFKNRIGPLIVSRKMYFFRKKMNNGI